MNKIIYPQLITIDQWLTVLTEVDLISDQVKEALVAFGNSENYTSRSSEVGKNFDYSNSGGVNLLFANYGKRVVKHLEIETHDHLTKDRKAYWPLFFYGFYDQSLFNWQLREELVDAMIELEWINGSAGYQNYVDEHDTYFEGKKRVSQIVSYERNAEARQKCIDHYGCLCYVCKFDFQKEFGDLGKGYIHVHHRKRTAYSGKEHEVNPIEDLIPLCPNCHAMIHKRKPMLKVDELVKLRMN